MAEGGDLPPLNAADPIDEIDGPPLAAAGQNQARINTVQLKIPPFWKTDPELWFFQVEAQFATAYIRSDLSKYNQIVGNLDSDTLSSVSDIIKHPPANDKYITLKNRLTNQFTESDRKKLHTLFSDLSLNDNKPSDLLRQMRNKSCNKVGEELLQELWTNRLPQQIQAILSCSTVPLTQQVIMADKIYETIDHSTIQALSHTNQLSDSDFNKKFCKLEVMIESLQKDINQTKSRNSSSYRNRSKSRSPSHSRRSTQNHRSSQNNRSHKNQRNWCWYHRQFFDKADKCDPTMDPPCNYKEYKHKQQSKN
jgi:hypothetical protein